MLEAGPDDRINNGWCTGTDESHPRHDATGVHAAFERSAHCFTFRVPPYHERIDSISFILRFVYLPVTLSLISFEMLI